MIKSGEKLQQTRLEKGLSLEDVARATKIKTQFLSYIENGEYQKLPSPSYAHGFVRNYARFLGLPDEEILALFRREFDEDKAYRILPRGLEEKQNFPLFKFKIRQAVLLSVIVLLLFIGYLLWQYRDAFLNPPLEITSPKAGTVLSSQIKITGKTDPNTTVYVDKNVVAVDQDGNFQKVINVFPGETTITVRVVNKFSKQTQKSVEIEVKAGT
ncbi:MAG TPA: helix-turn-helix domain-containing protein [Patescibacteria group bacterium]|jgi:cytoskeletal protein RodZ|nr:helix-turn-helix domain-containing protein [Patescibacteria group bacterium]